MKSLFAVCLTALLGTGAVAQSTAPIANPQIPLGTPLSLPPQPVSPLPAASPQAMTPTTPLVQPVAPAPAGTSPLADAAGGETPKPATVTKRKLRKSGVGAASGTSVQTKAAGTTKKATKKKKARKQAKANAAGSDTTAAAKPARKGKPTRKKIIPNDGSRP